ncbi:MAG: cell wall metabolism sensor histidine kinase WalK [Planctomycetes bacterium]|nr:cell wall metabolism sensor histidine kinase WalK [Planctomycetota bacterium]
MSSTLFDKIPGPESREPVLRSLRSFYLIVLFIIIAILIVVSFEMRFFLKELVVHEAERDAIRISSAIRDHEIGRLVKRKENGQYYLALSQEEMLKLDQELRIFLASFDIVKIKIFNAETQIIYSTDSKVIGKLDTANTKLAKALSGDATSRYENKDSIWDLTSEERIDVKLVETYVPISSLNGKIIGSFEIYKDITHDLMIVNKILIRVVGILLIITMSIFGGVVFVMYRASNARQATRPSQD